MWVLSFATVAELGYRALKAGWGTRRRDELERRIDLCVVLPGVDQVCSAWATINRKFADQIGQNDMWIAATALCQDPNLPVLTTDGRLADVCEEFGLAAIIDR